MKTSTLLKRAEKYLWDGVGSYDGKEVCICFALAKAACSPTRKIPVCAVIENRLRCSNYQTWAVRERHLPWDWIDKTKKWHPIIQANRLNWLRELQREYRAKGD